MQGFLQILKYMSSQFTSSHLVLTHKLTNSQKVF